MDPRIAPLDELLAGLEGLLSLLEAPEAHTLPALDQAWRRCTEPFERFRELEGSPGSCPEDVRARVERALLLHRLASEMSARLKEGLVVEKQMLSRARAHLESLRGSVAAGGSCNVAG